MKTDEEIVHTNLDDPKRHNVGGSMNRPPRNDDPLAPRNTEAAPELSVAKPFSQSVRNILGAIEEMLLSKNEKYGNSALDPVRIFSKADPAEQIKVRIDDKLSRIYTASDLEDEDVVDDLIGYLVLLKIAHGQV